MSKAKTKFPLDKLGGTIQGNDRTIGRDKGLASSVSANTTMSKADKKAGLSVKLVSRTAPTRGGSVNRHSQAEHYCSCDKSYSYLDTVRKANLETWWKKVSEKAIVSMSGHSVLMKVCLKYLDEYNLYLHFAWVQRYLVTNDDPTPWVNMKVVFEGIHTYQTDGQDCEAYLLLLKTTKKGKITYDPKMIDTRLVNDTTERGKTTVTIPSLAPGASCYVDIYSYFHRTV